MSQRTKGSEMVRVEVAIYRTGSKLESELEREEPVRRLLQ